MAWHRRRAWGVGMESLLRVRAEEIARAAVAVMRMMMSEHSHAE